MLNLSIQASQEGNFKMKKHEKHTKLELRKTGNYAPAEIAILGAKCDVIAQLSQQIAKKLQDKAKIAYLDASHNQGDSAPILDEFTFNALGILKSITATTLNDIHAKIQFSTYDLLLINGNHYQANQQIIVLDQHKEASIQNRIDQITDIKFLISTQENIKIFDCLKAKFPPDSYRDIDKLPVYQIEDIDRIVNHIETLIIEAIPPLNGLILVGGESVRMGTNKSLLNYHGLPQRDFLFDNLKRVLDKNAQVFLSARAEQHVKDVPVITDTFFGLGPFGAICSAFRQNPNVAYLVVATDLPFVNQAVLERLISKRNPKKIATALKGKNSDFMEPLIAIWEPKSYPVLLSFLALCYYCPRKVLINSDVEIVEVDDAVIQNVNTPEDFANIKAQLK